MRIYQSMVTRRKEIKIGIAHHVELPCKEGSATELSFALVGRMIFKELSFILECLADGLVCFNVALATVDDGNVTQTKGNDATGENIDNVRSNIPSIANLSHGLDIDAARYLHEVNFCKDTDGSGPFRIDFSGHF